MATDLWTGRQLGRASGRFVQPIPPHGAGLYRLSA
jgi:alpha-galactosidase